VPVAAIMAAALVAVPFVMVKPAEQAAAPAPGASTSAKPLQSIDSKALVKPVEGSISDGSALEAFLKKDPFKPVHQLEKEAGVVTETTDATGAQLAGPGTGETGLSDPFGGGEAAGGGVTGGGGTGGGGTSPPSVPGTPETTQKFTYVLDLTFTEGRRTRHIKSFERLGILPSQSNPLLVFLGVTASGNEAAFLVDSTLVTAGEGRCKPSESDCGFLYLEPGEEHNFTGADGQAYMLRIDQIRKVAVASLARAAAARARRARTSDDAPRARTAEGSAPERRRLVLPFLLDFEVEFGGQ
jgi:hypothetical protein